METKKRALITGITGMSGSHMADLLLSKGYEVYALVRHTSNPSNVNIQHLKNNPDVHFWKGDMTDESSLEYTVRMVQPDEIYHFAAQSHVHESWSVPETSMDTNAMGTLRLLEAIRKGSPKSKMLNMASSEMFGKVQETPQKETTRFYPRSPYGVSKVAAYEMTRNYRESYGLFLVNAISFNKESERRGVDFVTRKITDGVARIKLGLQDKLVLGNLDAKRDWGYSPEYCEGFWLALQQEKPDDYIFATGETHSVADFVEASFYAIGITEWQQYIIQDPKFIRPAEVDLLIGDASKAHEKLGWYPKTKFSDLVKIMVNADLERLRKEYVGVIKNEK